MTSHEKHQYYYEKYLREEMHDAERQLFEEKLITDESFKRSFNHYRSNRKEFLAELLEEDDEEASKSWGGNSWIYLLISITGIILAVYYFSTKKDTTYHTGTAKPASSWNIFKRIPFLSKKTEPINDAETPLKSNKTAPQKSAKTIPVDTFEHEDTPMGYNKEVIDGEDFGIMSDRMELDSFMIAYEKSYFESRLKAIKDETDSIIVDSMMQQLAIKSSGRNSQLSKPLTVYVEFWHSPVNFRGYRFNGKKLVIYGIFAPYDVYLLHEDDDFTLRSGKYDFELISDNNFHKF
jgi:hypothetical protein